MTLKSPEFSSPANNSPATFWKMEVFRTNHSDGGEYMGAKLFLRSCDSSSNGCWTKATFYLQYYNFNGSQYVWSSLNSWNSRTQKLNYGSDPICNDKLLKLDGRSETQIRIQCSLYVYMLDKPKHTPANGIAAKPSTAVSVPEHNLGQSMEEARQKCLLTDVTLVTGKKEFKAHRVVLAAQSAFFKTRFEQRWEQSGARVELNDVSPEILEAVLKYMYTGQVDKIGDGELACKLLSVADQYAMEKLRTTCEATLAKSISDENVVDVLILADTHNGKDLKKVCIEYVVRNPSQVKKNSAWSKMESKSEGMEKLRMEVFEACFNSLL